MGKQKLIKRSSILQKIKAFFIFSVMCRFWGHRINRYLIENSNQKECIRCGKIITVWDIMTIEEIERIKEQNNINTECSNIPYYEKRN